MIRFAAATTACARCATAATGAAGDGLDKSQFNLFNPTPAALMREMSPDRPDITESPYTVDAGHLQVESSFIDYTRDGGDFDAISVLPTNVKLGLTSNIDLQLAFEPYVREELADTSIDGFGLTQLRLKMNLWGNDGGGTAFALMPFVQFPTADDDFGATDHLEGGLILPLAVKLPHDWDLTVMAEFDAVRNADYDGYGMQFVHSASVGHAIAGDLGGYLECAGVASKDLSIGYVALLGAGLTYGVNANVQFDCGINLGLSDSADDFNVFAGVTVRQ